MTETSTELTTFAPDNPVAVLTSAEKFDELLGKIRAEVEAHKPDLTTEKGRKAIKSLAYKVTRTKTALDDAGKELNAAKRAEIDAVDAVRRDVRAKLDELADAARKPLTEWESAEEDRKAKVASGMAEIDRQRTFDAGTDSTEIQARIDRLTELEFDADMFQEALEIAVNAKASAIEFLTIALERTIKAEADAAELAELRRREAERDEADRLAAEKAAQAEVERIAEENRKAEIAAAAERAADAAKAEAARIAQAEIDQANAEAEALRQAERNRQEEADRIASETAAREADKAHRGAIMKAAKEAIMSSGDINENAAKKIVLAIVAGEVPNVILRF